MLALLVTSVLAAGPVLLGPHDARRLKPGVFLYAAPELTSSSFAESVVLLVRHEEEGSLGLIVNRPTRVPIREALRELGERRELEMPLYFGGPVQPDGILALVRSAKSVAGATRVLPDVYLSSDLGPVKAAARRPDAASRLRVYAGYAGWSAGQLADELRKGAWIVAPADAGSVFTSEPSSVWPRVYDLLRRIEADERARQVQEAAEAHADPSSCLGDRSCPCPGGRLSGRRAPGDAPRLRRRPLWGGDGDPTVRRLPGRGDGNLLRRRRR